MQYQKDLKRFLIIGLAIVPLAVILAPMALKIRAIALFSKYRALMPYILAQAKHETGNFTSKVFKENKNYFGMKLPRVRPSKAIGPGLMSPEGNNYARYASEIDSLLDLFMWMDYSKFPLAVESSAQYAKELKNRGYYGDTEIAYLRGINNWLT